MAASLRKARISLHSQLPPAPREKRCSATGNGTARAAWVIGGACGHPCSHTSMAPSLPTQPIVPGPTGVHAGCGDHSPPLKLLLQPCGSRSHGRLSPQFLFPHQFRFPTKHRPTICCHSRRWQKTSTGRGGFFTTSPITVSTALGGAPVANAPKGHYCRDILVPFHSESCTRSQDPVSCPFCLPYLREHH